MLRKKINAPKNNIKDVIKKIIDYMNEDLKKNVGESCPHAIARKEVGFCYPCIRERFG
jgi:hypothetical protein